MPVTLDVLPAAVEAQAIRLIQVGFSMDPVTPVGAEVVDVAVIN